MPLGRCRDNLPLAVHPTAPLPGPHRTGQRQRPADERMRFSSAGLLTSGRRLDQPMLKGCPQRVTWWVVVAVSTVTLT